MRAAVGAPGSVGVIAPDAGIAALSAALTAAGVPHGRLDADHGDDEDRQVELVPASIAKGLEFDRVVVVEPAAIAAAEPDERTGLRRLYVVLTRAVSELTVVHAEPLPRAAAGLTGRSAQPACLVELLGRAGRGGQPADQHVDEVRHLGGVDLHGADAGVAAPDRQHDEAVLRVPRHAQRPLPAAGVDDDLTTDRERGHLGHDPSSPATAPVAPALPARSAAHRSALRS